VFNPETVIFVRHRQSISGRSLQQGYVSYRLWSGPPRNIYKGIFGINFPMLMIQSSSHSGSGFVNLIRVEWIQAIVFKKVKKLMAIPADYRWRSFICRDASQMGFTYILQRKIGSLNYLNVLIAGAPALSVNHGNSSLINHYSLCIDNLYYRQHYNIDSSLKTKIFIFPDVLPLTLRKLLVSLLFNTWLHRLTDPI
jgi:hypothetical protein